MIANLSSWKNAWKRKKIETMAMQLSRVNTFSFGPVGVGGSIPEREDEFFVILSSRHSSRLFCDLYERGTPEAKLYALCGLRLANGDFEAYAERFIHETTKVETLGGCIGSQHSSTEAVAAVRQDLLEKYLPLRRKHERARIEYEKRDKQQTNTLETTSHSRRDVASE